MTVTPHPIVHTFIRDGWPLDAAAKYCEDVSRNAARNFYGDPDNHAGSYGEAASILRRMAGACDPAPKPATSAAQ